MKENIIVNVALDNLAALTGIKGKWNTDRKKTSDIGYDGIITLTLDNEDLIMQAEVKNEIRAYQIPNFKEHKDSKKPLLVVANNIFPKIKQQLRNENIAYLEANGNFFIKHLGYHIWIDGQKPHSINKKTGNRAFSKTGAKVVFFFLLDESYVTAPYRYLADLAQIALGNIGWIISGLEDLDFLVKLDKHRWKLQNKKELLNKWIAAYEEKLKPSLEVGTFRFLNEEDFRNWKNLSLNPNKSWWGGEPAGDLLTNYLRPETLTIYTEETRNELIKNYRLIPDPKGNIRAYKKFWQIDLDEKTAPPLLVYADLLSTNDSRCIETAQKIYDEYLQNKF